MINHPFVLKSEELILIKAEYQYDIMELALKLSNITLQERRFIRMVNKHVPIHSILSKEKYLEYSLIDFSTLEKLFDLLNRHGIEYNITDVSKEFIQKSLEIEDLFMEKVTNYIHSIMDLDRILDRLHLIGRYRLNDFEMFYLERASQGFVKI
ncbi:MAG: hypothetical protein FJZ67_11815 [Bacteroidetes bacterium]|nr:hypothetical protein [Bacteroidota bacterium]